MKGVGNERVDRNRLIDRLLMALAKLGHWASNRWEERWLRRRRAAALPPGTPVILTDRCPCATHCAQLCGPNARLVLVAYFSADDEYRVCESPALHKPSLQGCRVCRLPAVCADGFQVLRGHEG